MRNLVIVHGKPTEERYNNPDLPKPHQANWLPVIGAQAETDGIEVAIPAMPRPFYPEYQPWREVFDGLTVNSETGLVGHSAGAEFILRRLSEDKDLEVEFVALVAPYQDVAGKYGDFSRYDLDTELPERVGKFIIFNSLDDTAAIQQRAYDLYKALPGARLIDLDGYGHFMLGNNMTGTDFPELYEQITA